MKIKFCYILVGVPASGKSTWTAENYFCYDTLASSDAIIDQVSEEYGFTYSETFKELIGFAQKVFERDLQTAIDLEENVVIDRTNLTPKVRKKFIDQFKKAGYNVVAVFFETPGAVEWDRRLRSRKGKFIPQDVLNSMAHNLTYPSLEEGFDKITDGNRS